MSDNSPPTGSHPSTEVAIAAYERGYSALPIRAQSKIVAIPSWTHLHWTSAEQVRIQFDQWAEEGATNIGLSLGKRSNGLVDVDMDDPKATLFREHFLPPTAMKSGRAGSPMSHCWYRVAGDPNAVPGTRQCKMPDGSMAIELRGSGAQTLIPPSIHPSGEKYRWHGEAWGGEDGPAVIEWQVLEVQVHLVGLACVLLDNWPEQGGRHDAYLALAGGLLRFGESVHPWWERNLPLLIAGLADVTHDHDGPHKRVREVMETTLRRLRDGKEATGFPHLREIIGEKHVEAVQRYARTIATLAGFDENPVRRLDYIGTQNARGGSLSDDASDGDTESQPDEIDPLSARLGVTWQPVDIEPYLTGEIKPPEPSVLLRGDDAGLFYRGRVNMLYGASETAKSWIALVASLQEMKRPLGRVMYLDFEDEPNNTLHRLKLLGAAADDLRSDRFTYLRPEDPHEEMQRNQWGQVNVTAAGKANAEGFAAAIKDVNPTLIIADGMTVLYGLHGLNSNDAASTDIITGWLKRLCRNGRTTVIVIDHTGKDAARGASPIGAHHKTAMVQGASLQAHALDRPAPGVVGRIELILHKDRPGQVRKLAGAHTGSDIVPVAIVRIDSTNEEHTEITLEVPDPSNINSPALDKAMKELMVSNRMVDAFLGDLSLELTHAQIRQWVADQNDAVSAMLPEEDATRKYLRQLVNADVLSKRGKTGPLVKYRLRDPLHP